MRTFVLLLGAPACVPAQHVPVAQMSPEAAAAFERYAGAVDARMQAEVRSGQFLFVDSLPEKERRAALGRLKTGSVELRPMAAAENGRPIQAPQAMINDWVGIIFIPGVTLAQVLAVVEDYADYQKFYAPAMRRSRLLDHKGATFHTSLQFYRKSIVTVVLDADFEIEYQRVTADRIVCRSRATRIAEVENPGQPGERELTPDQSHGYLWRLNDDWRFQQRDGGVYVQLESIGMSRSLPAIVAWLANPLLRSIPRGILSSLLTATRSAVLKSSR